MTTASPSRPSPDARPSRFTCPDAGRGRKGTVSSSSRCQWIRWPGRRIPRRPERVRIRRGASTGTRRAIVLSRAMIRPATSRIYRSPTAP
jgi:hypothetical protein